MRFLWTILLLGCAGEDVTCGAGTTLIEGVCLPEESVPPTLTDVLAQVPACEPAEPDGRLDLERGCVDGGCAGMFPSELVEAWGEGDCSAAFVEGYMLCDWAFGVQLFLPDEDVDGVPDEVPVFNLDVDDRFDGTTETGVGLHQGFGCWLDHLGDPSSVSFQEMPEGYVISSAGWDQVYATDRYGGGKDGYDPDGMIESTSLHPPDDQEN